MKTIIVRIVTVIIFVVAAGLYLKYSSFSISDLFKSQPVVIEKTANIVDEIRRLAELTTATYHHDIVIRKSKSVITFFGIKIGNYELVLITKGKVHAGYDLSKLQEKDIIIDSLSITLKLPKAQILDIITNPSDFETFEESGKWSHEEVTRYKNEARTVLENNAVNGGILKLAEKEGKENLTAFFKVLGFENVVIYECEPECSVP
jgi:hypothetical protein